MARCPLCDRAFETGVLCPVWWQHYEVCRRPSCRAAAEDALVAVEDARAEFEDMARRIAGRNAERPNTPTPAGWRSDTMARMDHDGEDWGALRAAKIQHRGDA